MELTTYIKERKKAYGLLPVHELAILSFLNARKTTEDIAGIELQVGPISNDPYAGFVPVKKSGYAIGMKVAEKIMEKRKKAGRFNSITDLDIHGFGEDKFNDLLYTFMRFHSPLPTGLGNEFDEFITALGVLEADGIERGMQDLEILVAVRKLLMDKTVPAKDNTKFNWDRILSSSAKIKIPSAWGTDKKLIKAANIIQKTGSLRIGFRKVNINYLLAGIEAKLSNSKVVSPDAKLMLGTSQELSSFHASVAHSVFEYMQKLSVQSGRKWKSNIPLLNMFYSELSGADKLTAFADASNIDFNSNHFITINLLNYYTDTKGPILHSFSNFAEKTGFGKLKENVFENDKPESRTKPVNKILSASFLFSIDNGKSDDVAKMLKEAEANEAYRAYKEAVFYLYDKFIHTLSIFVAMEFWKPAITSWNRLEPRPRTNDFKRVLRAEIRDALWMLSRQWQMGEFAAEDAGTSVEMRVDMETAKLEKYSLHKRPAHLLDNKQPLETIVENEIVKPDLTLRLEMGKHWLRILEKNLIAAPGPIAPATINGILNDFKSNSSLHFVLPSPAANYPEIYSDPTMIQWYTAIGNGRAIDGNVLYKAFKSGTTAASYLSSTTTAITALVNGSATEFTGWFERIYSQPSNAADSAWDASHLEYQFHCSAPENNFSTTVLAADEYASGHLDWYNFDIETKTSNYDSGLLGGFAPEMITRRVITVLPNDVQFPGMPHTRWWKFEDYKVDLGGIKADTTEPAKLLLAEFALIYSNDWMLLPFGIDVGSICNVKSIIVKDVFGQYTQVNAAGASDTDDWKRWTMYNLTRRNYGGSAADVRLLIPPTTVTVMESEPVESVNLLRDEMANLVWGIESIIPDGRGGGKEGWEAGRRLFNYLQSITVAPPVVPVASNNAPVEYQVGTTVPEHWIPFIPVRMDSVTSREIQLRRAAMPRMIPGRAIERIRPRTELLRTGYDAATNTWNAYHLFEEEVLRSGSIVELTWQRTRWVDGSVITWLGRRKYTGRGEADSGLEFDTIRNKE